MRRLTLEGRIIVFKTLAISKIVFFSLISKVTTEIISELERIQKTFLRPSKPKIKNETLCSDFEHGGLKNVYIKKKIIRLQCSRVRRLYDDSFHEWKVTSLKLEKKSFGSHFKFHPNLLFNISCIMIFQPFTQTSSVTGKTISQPIQKLHRTFCLNICGLIKLQWQIILMLILLAFRIKYELRE